MAPGQVITATIAAAAGVKAAPIARALVPGGEWVKTGVVAGGGVVIIIGGVAYHRRNEGKGYVGPGLIGLGGGLTVGALCDHFGF